METEVKRTWSEDGYRCVVLEMNASSIDNWFCAYIEVPENHIAHGMAYEYVPVRVHGGLTYASANLQKVDEKNDSNGYWFGWDYNHAQDHRREVEITEVVKELEKAVESFKELSAEDIVENKIKLLPDKVKNKVEIKEVDE